MKFLIDECLHESLVGVAHRAGAAATHVNHLGLSGKPDWALAQRIKADEFTFVTNNRADSSRIRNGAEPIAAVVATNDAGQFILRNVLSGLPLLCLALAPFIIYRSFPRAS